MGAALWRREISAPLESETEWSRAVARRWRYRIEVFGRARAPWRNSAAEAMADAIRLDLASWDEERQEHFLAVPVDMRVLQPEKLD